MIPATIEEWLIQNHNQNTSTRMAAIHGSVGYLSQVPPLLSTNGNVCEVSHTFGMMRPGKRYLQANSCRVQDNW